MYGSSPKWTFRQRSPSSSPMRTPLSATQREEHLPRFGHRRDDAGHIVGAQLPPLLLRCLHGPLSGHVPNAERRVGVYVALLRGRRQHDAERPLGFEDRRAVDALVLERGEPVRNITGADVAQALPSKLRQDVMLEAAAVLDSSLLVQPALRAPPVAVDPALEIVGDRLLRRLLLRRTVEAALELAGLGVRGEQPLLRLPPMLPAHDVAAAALVDARRGRPFGDVARILLGHWTYFLGSGGGPLSRCRPV